MRRQASQRPAWKVSSRHRDVARHDTPHLHAPWQHQTSALPVLSSSLAGCMTALVDGEGFLRLLFDHMNRHGASPPHWSCRSPLCAPVTGTLTRRLSPCSTRTALILADVERHPEFELELSASSLRYLNAKLLSIAPGTSASHCHIPVVAMV